MAFRETLNGIIQTVAESFHDNSSGGAPVMLMLGAFKFSLNTLAFSEMQRSASYRWAAQERFGALDALQYTGPGEDGITLPGILYPEFRGGHNQISDLRALAAQGRPLKLIAQSGRVVGLWVIENVAEGRSVFGPDGLPRRVEFVLKMRKFA